MQALWAEVYVAVYPLLACAISERNECPTSIAHIAHFYTAVTLQLLAHVRSSPLPRLVSFAEPLQFFDHEVNGLLPA